LADRSDSPRRFERLALLFAVALCASCDAIKNPRGDLFFMGDRSTVGATLFIDGRMAATLRAQDTLSQFEDQASDYREWMAFRDSLHLGSRDELRLRDHFWGTTSEWSHVSEDAKGNVRTKWLGRHWVTMALDSVIVHEHLVDAALPRFSRSEILLVSARGETLNVSIHAYKYPGVTASFAQDRIESDSYEEWP